MRFISEKELFMKTYVLITPARNEEKFIEITIQSVVSQTICPCKWIIVSDGSTDKTDVIVEQYARKHEFIQLIRTQGDKERNFGSKVKAINIGYEYLKDLEFDCVGNLDADISIDLSYYEGLLLKFDQNERLGIAGGIRYDLYKDRPRKIHTAKNSVGGPIQFFRRECYEMIGGYRAIKLGGIDAVAETMARMNGWEVKTFPEFKVYHFRVTGTSDGSIMKGSFRRGMQHYLIGYHPLFQITSCIYHLPHFPVLIGSLAMMSGYFWAKYRRLKKEVPEDFIDFLQSEQLKRLRTFLSKGRDM